MLGYKDKTWCAASNTCKAVCDRRFTDTDRAAAKKWWGDIGFPLSMQNLRGSDYCAGYTTKENPNG